jgi:hypothetical protein
MRATAARRRCRTDCRIEPQGSASSLSGVPDGDNLLSLSDCLALSFGALRLGRSFSGGSLAFLRAAVRADGEMVLGKLYVAQSLHSANF